MGQTLRKVYDFSVEAPSLFLYIGEMQSRAQLLSAGGNEAAITETQSTLTLDSPGSAENLGSPPNILEKQKTGRVEADDEDIQQNDSEIKEI